MTPDAAILAELHRGTGGFVAAQRLAAAGGEVGDALKTRVTALRELGYDIEFHPHHGYRLCGGPDRLTADGIRAQCEPRVIGREILVFEETSSTNDVAERLARTDTAEGVVVFAESQTRGRGRQGRQWVSPRGKGLWLSVLLRPSFPVAAYPRLTILASVAVARAVRRLTQADVRIKWPNDIVIAGRKLAGILTESRGGAAILGIGVDVNCVATDFPLELRDQVTSLAIATGQPQDRTALAAALLTELDALYARAAAGFEAISDEWAGLCMTLGQHLIVQLGDRRMEGLAHALDADGTLLLRRDSGQIERLTGGELQERR